MPDYNATSLVSHYWPDANSRRYHNRQQVFVEGERKEWVYYVEAGVVCSYKSAASGRRQIYGFGFNGEIIGLGATDKYSLSAQSIGTATLKRLPIKALYEMAAKDGEFALQLYNAISSELEATRELLGMLCQHDAAERIAIFLLNLARRNEAEYPQLITLPADRGDIADLLDMKPETFSRALARLCEGALIEVEGRSKIHIKDVHGLQKLAGHGAGDNKPASAALVWPKDSEK